MICDDCGGELRREQGIGYIGAHVIHSHRADCVRYLKSRIETTEARLEESITATMYWYERTQEAEAAKAILDALVEATP